MSDIEKAEQKARDALRRGAAKEARTAQQQHEHKKGADAACCLLNVADASCICLLPGDSIVTRLIVMLLDTPEMQRGWQLRGRPGLSWSGRNKTTSVATCCCCFLLAACCCCLLLLVVAC